MPEEFYQQCYYHDDINSLDNGVHGLSIKQRNKQQQNVCFQ